MPQTSSDMRGVQFTAPLADIRMDKSGDPDAKGQWTMRGHAAVFNRRSHDLGGFRTVITPAFFNKILDTNPDVHLNREHDMRMLLARTLSNKSKLELRVDPYGLHTYARFVKTPLADETAALMEAGVLDQMSFACDIALDRWEEDESGEITRYLLDCGGLYDVAICAQGAFPQTDSQLVASVHDAGALLASAQEAGRVIRREQDPDLVASRGEEGDDIAPNQLDAILDRMSSSLEGVADVADNAAAMTELHKWAQARYSQSREAA